MNPYLRYTSSGSCLNPSFPNRSSNSSSDMECSITATGRPERSSSRFPCLFFWCWRTAVSSASPVSSTATASASLKNTIFPSFSIKEIWFSVSCFSDDLPKRCLFKSATCSNTSCRVWSICFSCACCARNSWMTVSLSRLFSFSSVYSKAMPLPPVFLMVLF